MPELEQRRLGAAFPISLDRQRLLPRRFYLDSPDIVAKKLLGKVLVRRTAERGDVAGRIIEVEAYFAGADPAAHAFTGQTARNAVLFGPPGHAYVYFIYGMYYCLNVSCEPEGQAGCVLIRALQPLIGLDEMAKRRMSGKRVIRPAERTSGLTSGPGRLCQALGITRAQHNGADLTSKLSELQIHDDGFPTGQVLVTKRIGIRKAADLMARFVLAAQ
jgi:DNA-3-methyladenine glycosylase